MRPAPLILPAAVLQGRHVRLEPYGEHLREPVRAALDCDPDAWQLFAHPPAEAELDGWLRAWR